MTLDATANYVAMHNRYAPPRRGGRPLRGKPPLVAHEAAYASRLITWLHEIRHELASLPSLLPGHVRQDSTHGRRVRSLTEPVRRKVERDMSRLEADAERAGGALAKTQRHILDRQSKAALGVDIPTRDVEIPGQIDRFVAKNMTRIRALGDKLISEVETIVVDAWDRGLSQDDVAAEIQKRLGVAESYARFLARDQMTTLYAQVEQARHDEMGVRLFRWWTQEDTRVRPHHAVKHGRIFPYSGSRAPSFFPGIERGCRCWREPIFDEIKAKAFAKGRGRAA